MSYAKSATKVRYGLLRDAYNALYDIPDTAFNLDSICLKNPQPGKPVRTCGAIACGIGWIGLLPKFQKLGLKTRRNNSVAFAGTAMSYDKAASLLFGMTAQDADSMFSGSYLDQHRTRGLSHKQVLLNRIMRYLDAAGEVDVPFFF